MIEDLYKKVNEQNDSSDEVQSDWKGGASPIPYKVAKALAPDYYRNIELDIWHELKRGNTYIYIYIGNLYISLNTHKSRIFENKIICRGEIRRLEQIQQ